MLYTVREVIFMERWLTEGFDRVNELIGQDPEFQQLLLQIQEAEKEYLEIVQILTASQREALENYIALCEELQYQKTIVAYQCCQKPSPRGEGAHEVVG